MASSTFDPACLEQMHGGASVKKPTAVDALGGIFCHICLSVFSNKKDYDSHYAHHNLGTNIVYTCNVCRKQIAGYPSFRNHCYLVHVIKQRYECEYCSKPFSKLSVLASHVQSMHRRKFNCTACPEVFSSKKELRIHQIIHKNEKEKPPYQCQVCSQTIESQDMCEMHIDDHCIALYPCPICDEIAPNKIEAAKHLSKHFDEEITEDLLIATPQISEDCSVDVLGGALCCYCDELFKNRVEFDAHFHMEHEDKDLVYSCNICFKQFEKYSLFSNHCYFHISKDRFQCSECDKAFPRLSLLVVHTEAFHSADSIDKPFRCPRCGYGFKTPARLREHHLAVHFESALSCTQPGCDKTFESPKHLILHQRHHKTTQELCCNQCGLPFSTLAACESHLDIHRKMLYSCPVCRKEYREKYLLIKHIPQHFESVLHICNVCGKVFNARGRLVEHAKIHSILRNYVCSYCGKGFVKPFQLEQHLNIHIGQKPYKCTVCPKTFANYSNLSKHSRRMHNIDKTMLKKTAIEKTIPNKVIVNNIKLAESVIDSTSSEISLEEYSAVGSEDNTLDSIDPIVIEKDWCIVNENLGNGELQYTNMLPVNDTSFDSAMLQDPTITDTSQTVGYPLEYGPDFGCRGVDTDDHYLPHIDPHLTTKTEPPQMYVNEYPYEQQTPTEIDPNWEPLITKVYHNYEDNDLNRLSFMNTDIF